MKPERRFLSVIIPTVNEAAALPGLLRQLRAQQGIALELIVADGGSTDATQHLAAEGGARVVESRRGRGAQMNAAARQASAPYLLFLHADSGLSSETQLAAAFAALLDSGQAQAAGHFGLRFVRTVPGHDLFYRYLEAKTRSGRRYSINGDQGLLLSAEYFRQLGGYDESLPFLEDQRIAARIHDGGRWLLLPGELLTSARRFEREGVTERYTLMAIMMGLHAAGAHEFFERAPQVYASQDQGRALDLRPFVQLTKTVLRERGRWRSLVRIGRFVRENAWQLALRRDLARGRADLPALALYDRHLASLLENPLADAVAALGLAGWLYAWLPWRLRRGT